MVCSVGIKLLSSKRLVGTAGNAFPSKEIKLQVVLMIFRASLVAQMVKCLPAMWETWIQSPGWEDPLEKEIGTHSSTLTWKIPWMEEPGRLQSMGSQWVGHNCATLLTGMIFSAWLKHDEKNFLGISSCDTLSSPMRQALLVLTEVNIWGSESRS